MTTYARLLRLAMPLWRWFALVATLTLVTIAANITLIGMSAYLISKAALVTEVAALTIAITSVRVFVIIRGVGRYFERLVTHGLAFSILTHLRTWYYVAIEPLAPAGLSEYRTGDLLTRSLADIETLEGFYVRVIAPPIAAGIAAVGACLFLLYFDWLAATVLFALLLVAGWAVPVGLRRVNRSAAEGVLGTRAELGALLSDQVQGGADLLVFDSSGSHSARIDAVAGRLGREQQRLTLVRSALQVSSVVIGAIAGVAVMTIAVRLVASGDLNGVYLAVLALVSIASFEAVQQVSGAFQQLDPSLAAGRRVFELIDAPPRVAAPREPAPPARDYSIELRNVRFRYSPDDRTVLDGLSFELKGGERLAIAGPSGSGKSTVLNLLLRFWDYDDGNICLGGRELRDYDPDAVRSLIAVVPQDVSLFHTTLRENLLLAQPGATDAELASACDLAQLGPFLAALPDGLDTSLGENGLTLSGGERQRLAVARAVLKDSPIVVLDEPTANLDALTEQSLMASLEGFFAGRTVVLISHRPAVWRCAGRVIQLVNGAAIEGAPAELDVLPDRVSDAEEPPGDHEDRPRESVNGFGERRPSSSRP